MANTENKAPKSDELKILIATPSYDGQCSTGYALSLAKTFMAFKEVSRAKVVHQFHSFDPSIPRARNYITANMLLDPSITHLMFIDADISWDPKDILKLIMAQKPIIGAAIPMKNYKWDRLKLPKVKALINDDNINIEEFTKKIKMYLMDYAVRLGQNKETSDGMIEVDAVGTAFMLIRRQVFEHMMDKLPQRKINTVTAGHSKALADKLYAFFDQENFDGEYLSSDYSFCRRYKQLGGRVFADLSITVGHLGKQEYIGNVFEVSKTPKK
ncbi:MAG: hypothetical protein AB7V32_10035 [Candidatus Berkiella sp.]